MKELKGRRDPPSLRSEADPKKKPMPKVIKRGTQCAQPTTYSYCARAVCFLAYSHFTVLGQQTRMRVHCGDLLRTLFVIVGAALVVYLFGCYIDVPPVRAGLQPDTARRALVAHSVP